MGCRATPHQRAERGGKKQHCQSWQKDKDGKTVKPAKIQREFSPADKTVEKQLVAIFEKHKPKEEYTLIDTSITIENGKARGIINCRINGEHKQIRIAE